MRAGWETGASSALEDDNPVGKQIELLKTAFGYSEKNSSLLLSCDI
ncbi:hypothetical protein [Bartonella sp. AA131HXZ]